MNDVNLLLANNPDFRFVETVFAPYTGDKTYTYKTMLPLEEGDMVIVQTPDREFKVVQVRTVTDPMAIDFDVRISYKLVVAKLDTTQYEAAQALEKNILLEINKSRNAQALANSASVLLPNVDVIKLTRL